MAHLAQLVDDVVVAKIELDQDSLTIGRAQGCDLRIEEQTVSSRHAQIRRQPDPYLDGQVNYVLEDLNSTNHTYVNGHQIERHQLRSGDLVKVGYNLFRFVDQDAHDLERTAVILPD